MRWLLLHGLVIMAMGCARSDPRVVAIHTSKEYLRSLRNEDWDTYRMLTSTNDEKQRQTFYEAGVAQYKFQQMLVERFGPNAVSEYNEMVSDLYVPYDGRIVVTTAKYPTSLDEAFVNAVVTEEHGQYWVYPVGIPPYCVIVKNNAGQIPLSITNADVIINRFVRPGLAMWKKGIELLQSGEATTIEQLARHAGRLGVTWDE